MGMRIPGWFRHEVKMKLIDKPHLVPLFDHVLDIPARLYEYSPDIFVVFNHKTDRFEIHSLDNKGDTYCATLPYKRLDERAVRYVYRNDVRVHGKDIMRRIEKSEEKAEKRQKREWHNWVESVAKETRTAFARGAWGPDDSKVVF